MANYCSNTVKFLGSEDAVAQVRELFAELERKQRESNVYHMPDFIKFEAGYMSDIETGQDWILYETRWAPNLGILKQIAEKFDLDFVAYFEEPMNGICGEAVYTQNKLHTIQLDEWDKESWPRNEQLKNIREMAAALLDSHNLER